ncbi:hypothetical protein SEA_OPIE_36 [Gordonia phage Opie]|nr:hypothetical protein SEA_OPIE_36 [Gordonia phage Opie]
MLRLPSPHHGGDSLGGGAQCLAIGHPAIVATAIARMSTVGLMNDHGTRVLEDECQHCGTGTLTYYRKTFVKGYGSSDDRREKYRALCSTGGCVDADVPESLVIEAGLDGLPPLRS